MKKILVTGGGGYIGSVLVGNLLNKNHQVRVLDRFMFGGDSLLSYVGNKNLDIQYGDIRDLATVKKALESIDQVIHLAAFVGEPACKENPKVTNQINFEATKQLVKYSRERGIQRFIFSSTCSNYGISKGDEEADENYPLNPLSLYAKTKISSEQYILSQKDNNFHPTVLRLATIFGLSPRMRFNLLVNEMARETATDGKIEIRNENAWRPFLHTQDASNATIRVLEAKEPLISGEIFNLVSENVQKKQLIEMARKESSKVKITVTNATNDDLRDYRVSSDKFKKTLSWKPAYSVQDGFKEVVSAIRKNLFLDPYQFSYNGWFDTKVFNEQYEL